MSKFFGQIACIAIIAILLISSGCVAPPKETPGSSSSSPTGAGKSTGTGAESVSPTGNSATAPTETTNYVTMETPFGGNTPSYTIIQTTPPVTPVADEYVQIYGNTQFFAYNKTAFSFDLKNPPMLIDFTEKPINSTGTNTVQSRAGGHGDQTVNYDYFSPTSWYQVTVRNKVTGDIILQDGFQNGYSMDPGARTIKILNRGNFLIELSGNQVTATTNISVKRAGNIGNSTV